MTRLPPPVRVLVTVLARDHGDLQRVLDSLTEEEWTAAVVLADRELVTPALHPALVRSGCLAAVPPDVVRYLVEITRLNRIRNRRIRAQLLEVLGAFNATGIAPLLLKGAAPLLEKGEEVAQRMMLDIDLLLDHSELDGALRVFGALGYRQHGDDLADHAYAYVVRSGEPAAFDLHRDLIGLGLAHLLPVAEVRQRVLKVEAGGVTALVPSPEDRFVHLVLHEMAHHRAHVNGVIRLRALLDFARFIDEHPGLNWPFVLGRLHSRGAMHILRAQALAAHRLFGAVVPAEAMISVPARFYYWRGTRHWCRPVPDDGHSLSVHFGKLLAYPFDPATAVVPLPVWVGRGIAERFQALPGRLRPGLGRLRRRLFSA